MLCFPYMFVADYEDLKLLGLTVATDETDGFKRFMRSADIFNIQIKVGYLVFIKFSKNQTSNEQATSLIFTFKQRGHCE